MKKIALVLAAAVGVLVVLGFVKNAVASSAVQGVCRAVTGLELKIGSLNLGLISGKLDVKNLKLNNPKGFADRTMVDMPELYVDLDTGSLVGGKGAHLRQLRLYLKELVIVKSADGKLNLDALKPKGEQKAKEPGKKSEAPAIRIDQLKLKVDRVVYKDYSKGGQPSVQTFDINLNESYDNISNINVIVPLLVSRAVLNTAVSSLVKLDMKQMMSNFDLSAVDLKGVGLEKLSGLATNLGKTADGALGEAAGTATAGLKSVFGALTGEKE